MLQGTKELREGECCFDMSFYDTRNDIPSIQTWVYVGKNLLKTDATRGNRWYFQDPKSYLKHGSFVTFTNKLKRTVLAAEELTALSMFSLKGLAEALALLHPKSRKQL
jgi:hypothetical protein